MSGRDAFVAAFREALRTTPRYWMRVTDRPAERSAPCYFAADVERAISIALTEGGGSFLPLNAAVLPVDGRQRKDGDDSSGI